MKKSLPKSELSKTEWTIMNICWKKGKTSARDIYEASLKDRKRSYHTIKTMLDRLVKKNFLDREKFGPIWLYTPVVPRSKALRAELSTFVKTVLDNTFTPILSFLSEKQHLSDDEIDALEKLIADHPKETRDGQID